MITVPYSLLCVKIETGFFFALLILPKLRWFSTADWQVGIFLFALYVQLHSIEIIAKKAVLHLVTHHLHKKRSRIAALYTKKAAEDTSTMGRVLGGIRLSGVLRSENVLLYSLLSASTIFSEGRYKNIQIDRLCDKGMLFCNSPKISFFLNYSWPIACFAASIPKV